ncbi:MAG: GHKL domain-containing protein [Chitinophagaceae bacterium]|nr:MAG: GHKL domain-containing protein [Chitinophagaceae bacterium]
MKLNIENIIRSGYFLAFILIVASYILFFYSLNESKAGRKLIYESNLIINTLGDLSSASKDVETGVRGYILTRDSIFLQPTKIGQQNIITAFASLNKLISSGKQALTLDTVQQKFSERKNLVTSAIAVFNNSGRVFTDSLKSLMYPAKLVMDEQRRLINKMQVAEHASLKERELRLNAINNSTTVIAITSLLIVAVLITYSLITYNKENRDKKTADHNASSYYKELETRVVELDKKNKELAQLRSIEKFAATGRMASTMAHEIKNPLNNIVLSLEHLKDNPSNDEMTINLLDIINRNANRVNILISDLLNSTRFLELNFASASINDIVDETLENARDRLELNNIKVVKNYDKDICKVSVDTERIKIAFMNIIINAIEAIEQENGVIEIKTEAKDDNCVVTISDNGKGMDQKALSKLFEPFITSKSNGTGLGLTNSQNIILNHKGSINVESAESKGATFIIQLPFH